MTKYVYLVVAYDHLAWNEWENKPRTICAYLDKEAANKHERDATEYAAQFASRMNFPYDNPHDPESKSQNLCRSPWYDVETVELKGL